MFRELEYRGEWWLPQDPNKKVGGTFRFSPDKGVRLELAGVLEDSPSGVFAPERVWGIVPERRGEITLYRCLEVSRQISGVGAMISDFVAQTAFLGAHIDPEKHIFSSIRFESSELDSWANFRWVEFPQFKDLMSKRFCIEFEEPEPFKAILDDGTQVLLEARITRPKLSRIQREVCLQRKTFFRIIPPTPRPYNECRKLVHTMLDLVSFALLYPAIPTEVVGHTSESGSEVEILYGVSRGASSDRSFLHIYWPLFNFNDICNEFELFVRKWFDIKTRLEPVSNLYLATLRASEMPIELAFLTIVHALEAFHRLKIGGQELPEEEHQKRVKEITDSVPSQWRQWLMEKFKYSNEVSLRARLADICEMFIAVANRIIGGKKDIKHFISTVIDTRNYLTHYDPELKQKAADPITLFDITERLKILVECCLLRELGFSEKWIVERIKEVRLARLSQAK
ncbi:MAG: hypothetical protein H5T41_10980 [Methanomassiliicoccales archaeon]|nr:hypothetical protein [Methanomassiliicoccales archaeon]